MLGFTILNQWLREGEWGLQFLLLIHFFRMINNQETWELNLGTHCEPEQLCSCLPSSSTNLARLVTKVTKENGYLAFKYCTLKILL